MIPTILCCVPPSVEFLEPTTLSFQTKTHKQWRIQTFGYIGDNLMFPSISRLFLRCRGPNSIAKLDGSMAGFSTLPESAAANEILFFSSQIGAPAPQTDDRLSVSQAADSTNDYTKGTNCHLIGVGVRNMLW